MLDAPGRLGKLVNDGQEEEARSEWSRVSSLLDKWDSVSGVKEVRLACEKAMEGSEE